MQSPSIVIFEPKKTKSVTVSIFSPSICHEVMGREAMIFIFWMLSFKPAFLLSSFNLIPQLYTFKKLRWWLLVPSLHHKEKEKKWKEGQTIFLGSKITVDCDCSHEIKRRLCHGRKAMINPDSIKKQSHHFANKGPNSYGFSSSHAQMWELDHKEGWAPKNWCFQIVVLENTLQNRLDSKIKPVNPKGHQP